MAVFWLLATAMLGVALTFVLRPLLRRGPRAPAPSPEDLNVAVHRDRLARLEEERADGELDLADYEQARAELECALLEELSPVTLPSTVDAPDRGMVRWSAAVVALSLPALVIGLYWQLGTPATDSSRSASPSEVEGARSLPPVDEMVASLERRLREEAHDGEGWLTLARSYAAMERFTDAAGAFARAHELIGDQPDLLVDYAEAEILAGGEPLDGKPTTLVSRALAIEPRHLKGLWIAGFAARQRGEREAALGHWRELQGLLPPDSRERAIVERLIAGVTGESDAVPGAPASPASPGDAHGSGVDLTVHVSIASEIVAKARPSDTVFVFARAVDGPPIPVAIARLKVSDLPSEIVLDDTMSVMPSTKLSDQKQVVIGARISRSGNAMPQQGDLQGMSGLVDVEPGAAPVELVISHEIE